MQVEADEARATGLNFDNSEWNLSGDVQILVPDGKPDRPAGEGHVPATTRSCAR